MKTFYKVNILIILLFGCAVAQNITPHQLNVNSSYVNSVDDNFGNTYLVYQDGDDTDKRGKLLKYNGTSWNEIVAMDVNGSHINPDGSEFQTSALKVDSHNKLHIAYIDYFADNEEPILAYLRYNANSTFFNGWESYVDVNNPNFLHGIDGGVGNYTPLALDIAMDINSSDTPIIAYINKNDSTVHVRYLNDHGTLGNDTNITNFSDDSWDNLGKLTLTSTEIDMALYNDIPYLAYKENVGGKLSVLKFENDVWKLFDANISTTEVSNIRIKYEADDNLYLYYVENNQPISMKLEKFTQIPVDEENTNTITSITISNATHILYSLDGEDKEHFTITNDGNLSFVNPANYEIFGDNNNDGIYEVTVNIKNVDTNLTSQKSYKISLNDIDDAPVLGTISNISGISEDGTINDINITASDADGQTITYRVTASNDSLVTVSVVDGKIKIIPVANRYGDTTITLIATANNVDVNRTFDISINPINDTPTITSTFSDISVLEDSGVTNFELNVSDVDGDDLNVTVTSSNENLVRVTPNWNGLVNIASYQGLDFNISTVPNANGIATITLTVEDADGETNTQSFDINVTAVNDAPTLSLISDVIVYKNSGDKNITVVASDVENTSLTYSATVITSNKIEYATFTNNILSIKPLSNISGDTNITVTLADGELSTSRTFNFYIVPIEDGVDAERVGIINKSTDSNGTTTTLSIDSNLTVNAQTKTNGDTTHRIEVAGKTIEATSSINGSVVEIVDGGVHTTYNENNLAIEAEATLLGEATHKLTTNGKTAEATSQIVGATTVISEVSGMKQITTSVDMNNTTISVKAKADGTAEHTVTLQSGTISKTTSDIGGAKTTITNSGAVKTEAGDVVSGSYTVKALAITQPDGKTITRFIKVNNSDENDVQILGNTVKTATPFEAGNNVEIQDIGGMLYIKTSAPLDANLEIE